MAWRLPQRLASIFNKKEKQAEGMQRRKKES